MSDDGIDPEAWAQARHRAEILSNLSKHPGDAEVRDFRSSCPSTIGLRLCLPSRCAQACFRSRKARCCRTMPWPLASGGCARIPLDAPLRCCWRAIRKGTSGCGRSCGRGRRRCGGASMPGSGASVSPETPPQRSSQRPGRPGKPASLINSDSASLTRALRESHNYARDVRPSP